MHLVFRLLAAAAMITFLGSPQQTEEKHMKAEGTFQVKVTPAEATPFEKGMGVGRYEVDKTWAGSITGTSKGEMLSSFTETTGSMAYVAMEAVTGKLDGKEGSFYLAHKATMTKGNAASGEMHVEVVKGSGTGQLAGLRGELTILIDATGKHSYMFAYDLPS